MRQSKKSFNAIALGCVLAAALLVSCGDVPDETVSLTYVKASNTGANDIFGFSIALSSDGNTLAVGAPLEASNATGVNGNQTDNSFAGAGAVYIYIRSGTTWTQQAYVKASNTGAGDNFGVSVALSGDGSTLAVGAPLEDSSTSGINSTPNDSAAEAGAAYLFRRVAGVWTQQAYVKASNPGAGDNFGVSVALSADGNTLAVGANGEDSGTDGVGTTPDEAATNAGAVYVFTFNTGTATWSEQAYVKASNSDAVDKFGVSVALSSDGNTLAVGANGEASGTSGINTTPDESAPGSGAVYVFTRTGVAWSQQAYVKASNTGAGDNFGVSVALSGDGNTLAVGASQEASSATGINGNQTDNSFAGAGAVYAYVRAGATWTQQAYVKASNTGVGDNFGVSVALASDGNTLAVGAINEDSSTTGAGTTPNELAADAGAVYAYTRSAGVWTQQNYLKASNTGGGDSFGISVALSSNGITRAVGAQLEDSAATGVGGNQSDNSALSAGAVYVFQ